MKKVLIVLAHPNHQSLNYALCEQLQKGLADAGHEVQLLDLYAEQFDPVLVFNKDNRRRDIQHVPAMEKYREQIRWAEHVVYIFPIWWGGMPAILKGYFDRVFATGFSYHFNGVFPQGHLKGKTAWILTTDDTPAPFRFLAMQDYGKVLKRQILSLMTGVKVKRHKMYTYLKGRKPEKIQKWLEQTYQLGRAGL